jgi:hypothetical protein
MKKRSQFWTQTEKTSVDIETVVGIRSVGLLPQVGEQGLLIVGEAVDRRRRLTSSLMCAGDLIEGRFVVEPVGVGSSGATPQASRRPHGTPNERDSVLRRVFVQSATCC